MRRLRRVLRDKIGRGKAVILSVADAKMLLSEMDRLDRMDRIAKEVNKGMRKLRRDVGAL